MKKPEIIDIEVQLPDKPPQGKNTDGHLGPICNNCAGFGYTLRLKGESAGGHCMNCEGSGVARMTHQQLQNQVVGLSADIKALKDIIIKFMEEKKDA